MTIVDPEDMPQEESANTLPPGCQGISSPMTASVFQVVVEVGQRVEVGQKVIVRDAMKTEIAIPSSVAGTVEQIYCTPSSLAQSGQLLVAVRP